MPIPAEDAIRVVGTDRVFDRRKVLVVLLLPLAMALMAISSVNVALPAIAVGLDASASDIQWVLAGYALAFGVTLVPGGRIGDALGHGTLFVVGLGIFTVFSLVGGLAPDPLSLNFSRFAMGIGAGLNGPQVNGMIQQYYTGHERARAFAMFGVVVSVSVAAGPLITGSIIALMGPEWGWRASFLLNGLIGAAAVWLALRWLPFGVERERRIARATGTAAATKIDLDPVGAVLLIFAVLGVMLPFILKTWWGWLLVPVGLATMLAWVRWERAYAARGGAPMVDMQLFSHRNFTVQTAISGVMFIGTTSIFSVLALFLQQGLGASALDTSLVGLPEALLSGVLAIWAGGRVMRQGRTLIVVALVSFIVSIGLMIVTVWLIELRGITFWWLILPLAIMGLGHGAMGSPNQTIAVVDVPANAGGVAGGVKQTAERIGTALGNAMITGIYFAVVVSSPTLAITISYATIIAIVCVSLAIAIVDRRKQGPALLVGSGAS